MSTTTPSRPALRLVTGAPLGPQDDALEDPLDRALDDALDDAPDDAYVTVPVPRSSGAARGGPWAVEDDVAWVPAVLLLAASGRCSCEDCCLALARRQRRARVTAV